ncbi:MAG: hydrogenase iron-sulfur subunit [Thermoplasmata archaeon]|nr:MAG: hydrogenase iron-sulfur subunit [Thermoplasmata archaeon]
MEKGANPKPDIIQNQCFGCGNCVIACPENAIGLQSHNYFYKADIDHEKCTSCGTCIPACWCGALQQPGATDKIILDKINSYGNEILKAHGSGSDPGVLAFVCNFYQSALGEDFESKIYNQPSDGILIKITCIAQIKPEYISKALGYGFDGVLIIGCCNNGCTFTSAAERAIKRFTIFCRLLDHLGLDSKRISLNHNVPCNSSDLLTVFEEFKDQLKQRGPNPLKTEIVENYFSGPQFRQKKGYSISGGQMQ